MQHLREGTRTTFSVPRTGIIFLIFSLIGHAIDDNVIHFDIAITSIIGKCNAQLTGSVGLYSVVEHADAQCPGLDGLATDLQADTFVSGNAAHGDSDAVVTATN